MVTVWVSSTNTKTCIPEQDALSFIYRYYTPQEIVWVGERFGAKEYRTYAGETATVRKVND
jgi:hypothetical protein